MLPEGDTADESVLEPFRTSQLLKKQGFRQVKVRPYEFTLNNLPEKWIRPLARISALIAKAPLVRYLGGSLKITAVKQ